MPPVSTAYRYLPAALAERLRGLALTVKRPVEGTLQGAHRSPHYGASVEFAEYREYSPGDPPALIDWAVYARGDRYMIRRFQEETNIRAMLCLDTSESLLFQGPGAPTKLEFAARLAAGLLYLLVNQGDAAGLLLFDSAIRREFAPTTSLEGLRPLLLGLEAIQPAGLSRIDAALHQAADSLRRRSLVVVISDFLQEPAGIFHGLRHLHHNGHDLIVLHVFDEAEIRFDFEGLTEFHELETGRKLMVEASEIRGAYQRAVAQYLDELRRGCQSCRAQYHQFSTATPVDELLFMKIANR